MSHTNPQSLKLREPHPLRGALRLLWTMGHATLTEFPLQSGHRADILAIDAKGIVTLVEIKSSVADFRADQKWPCYLEWCDAFYFAVDLDFPRVLIPETVGLIISDAYDGEIARGPIVAPLSSARRKTLTLRFARLAAARLARLNDPDY